MRAERESNRLHGRLRDSDEALCLGLLQAQAARDPHIAPAIERQIVHLNRSRDVLNGRQVRDVDRAAHGLPALSWSNCLSNVAVSNAKRIAAQGYLSHTTGPQVDLSCHLGNHAGENIGYWSQGINDAQINTMFMNSPEHYANIMGPYHYVATAWVVASNGYGYVAVEFS